MSATFAFEPEVTRGQWIADRLDQAEALGGAIPSGFEALVRVLHPFGRDRPTSGTWSEWIAKQQRDPTAAVPATHDETGISWRTVAAAHHTELTPASLSHELLGLGYGEHRDTESEDGWRYRSPEEGSLDAEVLGRVAAVLAAHTQTPSAGVAAVWEGWGGLVSAQGVGFFFAVEGGPARLPAFLDGPYRRLRGKQLEFAERKRRFGTGAALRSLVSSRWNQPAGSGVLSKEAAAGPRLELPARNYICFDAGIDAFAANGGRAWIDHAPWIDDPTSWWIQSPNVIWPDDHEWFLLTEIDFDSTLIACTRECAEALLAAEGIDAVEITRDTPLWSVA